MLPCHEGRPGGGIGHALGARGANAVLRKQATLSDSRVLVTFANQEALASQELSQTRAAAAATFFGARQKRMPARFSRGWRIGTR
jgi:hypothetical protein